MKTPVIFNDRKYFGIRTFDCIVVNLYTEKTLQGTFFTCIPISSKEYRKKHPTKAKVKIIEEKDWTVFKITSDHGATEILKIHNSLGKEIEIAKKSAIDEGLLE